MLLRFLTGFTCSTYPTSLNILDELSSEYKNQLSDVLKDGKKFRLVGDNISWNAKVCDQRLGRTGKMTNAFTSACVVQEVYFDELDDKKGNLTVSVDTYMFGEKDYECVKKLYVSLVLEVAQRHLKSIAFINSD